MAMEKLVAAVVEDAEERAFREWTDASVVGRWELGRERYHRESIDFKGLPIAHSIEEALDLLVYLWVSKRRRDAGGNDAEWRPMTEEAQRGCQEWVEAKLLMGYDSESVEDRAIHLALQLLRILWEEKEEEALAVAAAPAKRETVEVTA